VLGGRIGGYFHILGPVAAIWTFGMQDVRYGSLDSSTAERLLTVADGYKQVNEDTNEGWRGLKEELKKADGKDRI